MRQRAAWIPSVLRIQRSISLITSGWSAPFPTAIGKPPPSSGLRHDRITAPFVIDRAMNGAIFRTYVKRCLAPTLQPGDVVILDNLPAHKVTGVRRAIETRGARLLYLPPYSPDLNPIEQVFAKLKALLRKAAERSIDALWHRIGHLLDPFTADERRRYFTHAGYV